jgi:tRNA(Ile)-lysidine synthase
MLKIVQSYIDEHNMIKKGDRIVLGVSGGADSVCLFHVLIQLLSLFELTLFVVHVNHGIRGEEADEDETFVKDLCEKNNIQFEAYKADVPALAKLHGITEEEAGRNIRYEAFYDCFKKNKCNKIAIAHNKNDNAETILFHLFRGSGIKGLTGIPIIRNQIIRPILCVKREEIEVYLKENNFSYRNDRTNFTEDYSRNKIRHRIISYAQKELNNKVVEHIVNAANHLGEISSYLEKNTIKAYDKIVKKVDNVDIYELPVNLLKEEDRVIQKGIVRLVYENLAHGLKDVEALHIEQILSLQDREVGKRFYLPYKVVAEKGYDNIIISIQTKNCKEKQTNQNPDSSSDQVLTVPGEFFLPYMNQTVQVSLKNYKKNMIIPKNGCTKWFDYDKIKNTVLIRTRKEGDFIQIDSLGNRKKIKSLFIDDKIPREQRNQLPLIADGNHIIWVVGGRMSEAYKVSDKTKIILEISLNGGKQDARQN